MPGPSGTGSSNEARVFDHRPIYGHIRFSFYGFTDTRLKPDPDDKALAELYDETRMARRFFLFENLDGVINPLPHDRGGYFGQVTTGFLRGGASAFVPARRLVRAFFGQRVREEGRTYA